MGIIAIAIIIAAFWFAGPVIGLLVLIVFLLLLTRG